MNNPLDNLLRDELKPGERLLWHGQPDMWRLVRSAVLVMPVGFLVAGFSVFILFLTYNDFDPAAPNVFGFLPIGIASFFLLVGLATIFYPFYAGFHEARNTLYAITSAKAIIITPRLLGGFKIRSFLPSQLRDISRNQFANGSGDLFLASDHTHDVDTEAVRDHTPVAFHGIPDVRNVERILTAMRDENLRASNQGGKA